VLFLVSAVLFVLFCTYPFAWPLFAPLAISVGVLAYWRLHWGLGIFILTLLTTLQLPVILGYPFFFGPEPIFLAFCAAVSLRALVAGEAVPALPLVLKISLSTYALAILASALLVWLSIWDLPGRWPMVLTLDALGKVFFWRWENPFHFLRITLLYLEGMAAFFLAVSIYRRDPEKTARVFLGAFLLCGILLMGYSAVELLFRGKELTIYPGFGPVFMDRNAYAAFWVLYLPFAIGLGFRTSGRLRAVFWILAAAYWFWCIASLSFTGILVSTGVAGLSLLLYFYAGKERRPGRVPKWYLAAAMGVLVVMAIFAGFIARELVSAEKSSFLVIRRVQGILREGPLGTRMTFWLPAARMFGAYPLLGIGPGEVYRNLDRFRTAGGPQPQAENLRAENAHNFYLQLGAEIGIVGLTAFVTFFGWLLWRTFRSEWSRSARDGPGGYFCLPAALAIAGLAFYSLAQHPTLRFEFQVLLWILAGLLVGSLSGSLSWRVDWRYPAALLGLVVLAMIVHVIGFPRPPLAKFEYGFHRIHGDSSNVRGDSRDDQVWLTESVAFLRRPLLESPVAGRSGIAGLFAAGPGFPAGSSAAFAISSPVDGTVQSGRIELNGRVEDFTVEGDSWKRFEVVPGTAGGGK